MPCAFCYLYDKVCENCGEAVDISERYFIISTDTLQLLLADVLNYDILVFLSIKEDGWHIKVMDPNKVMMGWFILYKNEFDVYPYVNPLNVSFYADKLLKRLKENIGDYTSIKFKDVIVLRHEGVKITLPIEKFDEPETPILMTDIQFKLMSHDIINAISTAGGYNSYVSISNESGILKMEPYKEIKTNHAFMFDIHVDDDFKFIYGTDLLKRLTKPLMGEVNVGITENGVLLMKTKKYIGALGPRVEEDV